ncbi:MAG: lipopolysaccharide biosynthesis protein [Calditrichaeota bacterium]|nr:MAG: lipopolysaccharide biosynthesis protein [Calditrichota bacterium]MBL1206346.1 lipopolysaccharide biosynthesis protein [Calditrichota bacterium]NOG46172.1 lipopolysaccharide biosynthesis protein [Calditrichota bacterium]
MKNEQGSPKADKVKSKSLAGQAKKGILWTLLRAVSSQGARFVASIVLARILFPEDFGIIGIVLIVTRFAQRLGNFGFTQVLIQKKLIDENHIRTTFTINLILAFLTTSIIIIFAPQLATIVTNAKDVGHIDTIVDVLRVISFSFILISLYAVPNSLLKRELKFKQESLIGIVGGVVRFLSPIGFALFGHGVWSIVYGMLLGDLIQVIAFYSYSKWKPRIGLNKVALNNVFSFGIWMNLQSYVQYFYKNSAYFFVSKFLGLGMLGYYERAYNLMNSPRKRVSDMISSVLFATFSRIQDEEERLISAMRKVMGSVALLTFPLMTWLYFAAPSLIPLVYGDKWILTVQPLQIMSISGLIESVTMVFYPVFLAKGLVKNRTKAHTIVLIFLLVSLFFSAQESIVMVAWAVVATSLFGFFVNAHEYIRNSGWTWKDNFISLKPAISISLIMIGVIYTSQYLALNYFSFDSPAMLIVISLASALGFFGSNYIFKFAEVAEVINLVRGKKSKKSVSVA